MRTAILGIGGSMGSRRCRNLQALGHVDIVGYDINTESAMKVATKYNIQYIRELSDLWNNKPDIAIISVPPLLKQKYIDFCNKENIPCFVEADITKYSGKYCPSATMRFHPGVMKIKELLSQMGKVYSFTYHHGSHLSDWRPNGFPADYYAAKKESSACMEMFAFELSWLSYLFGIPIDSCGFVGKKLNMENVTADDVYSTIVKTEQCCGTFQNDMVTRPTIRELRVSCEKGTLKWNWDDSFVSILYPEKTVVTHGFNKGEAASGYNANICEFMYEREIANFINVIQCKEQPMYTREEEEAIMKMLRRVEGE